MKELKLKRNQLETKLARSMRTLSQAEVKLAEQQANMLKLRAESVAVEMELAEMDVASARIRRDGALAQFIQCEDLHALSWVEGSAADPSDDVPECSAILKRILCGEGVEDTSEVRKSGDDGLQRFCAESTVEGKEEIQGASSEVENEETQTVATELEDSECCMNIDNLSAIIARD